MVGFVDGWLDIRVYVWKVLDEFINDWKNDWVKATDIGKTVCGHFVHGRFVTGRFSHGLFVPNSKQMLFNCLLEGGLMK